MKDSIIKLRTKKNYSKASNHVLIGSVTEFNKIYIQMNCRTFHFKNPTLDVKSMIAGELESRIVPWNNIECINILPNTFCWESANLEECETGICLRSKDQGTLISRFKSTHQ